MSLSFIGERLKNELIDQLAYNSVFNRDRLIRQQCAWLIRATALYMHAQPASLHDYYVATLTTPCTPHVPLPAIHLRTLTYDMARAIFRAAKETRSNAFCLALSADEMKFTDQTPLEFSAVVLAAALKEAYHAPHFFTGRSHPGKRQGIRKRL